MTVNDELVGLYLYQGRLAHELTEETRRYSTVVLHAYVVTHGDDAGLGP